MNINNETPNNTKITQEECFKYFKLSDHMKLKQKINGLRVCSWNCIFRRCRSDNNSVPFMKFDGKCFRQGLEELINSNFDIDNMSERQKDLLKEIEYMLDQGEFELFFLQEIGINFANYLMEKYKYKFNMEYNSSKTDMGNYNYGILSIVDKTIKHTIKNNGTFTYVTIGKNIYINVHIPMSYWPLFTPMFKIFKNYIIELNKTEEIDNSHRFYFIGDLNWNIQGRNIEQIIHPDLIKHIDIFYDKSQHNLISNATVTRVDQIVSLEKPKDFIEIDDKELNEKFYKYNNCIGIDISVVNGEFDKIEEYVLRNMDFLLNKTYISKLTLLEYLVMKQFKMIERIWNGLDENKKFNFVERVHEQFNKKISTFGTNILQFFVIFGDKQHLTLENIKMFLDMMKSKDEMENKKLFYSKDNRKQDIFESMRVHKKRFTDDVFEQIIVELCKYGEKFDV